MFLNYIAGVSSLVLAISSFVPWVTVWFYSLKGIDNMYGILILIVGLLGATLAISQHFSGKIRGRAYILYAVVSLICEGIYIKKMAVIGARLTDIGITITDIFKDEIVEKIYEILGEKTTKILFKLTENIGFDTSIRGIDFVGDGLILAVICSVVLLVVGILLEKNQTTVK